MQSFMNVGRELAKMSEDDVNILHLIYKALIGRLSPSHQTYITELNQRSETRKRIYGH